MELHSAVRSSQSRVSPTVADSVSSPWEQEDHPIKETVTMYHAPRPTLSSPISSISGPARNEKAEETTHIYRQNRTRTRDLDDGSTVLEEQEVVFTEKRVIWLPLQVKEESGEGPPNIVHAGKGGEESGVEKSAHNKLERMCANQDGAESVQGENGERGMGDLVNGRSD